MAKDPLNRAAKFSISFFLAKTLIHFEGMPENP
jgi:hypothetical protein